MFALTLTQSITLLAKNIIGGNKFPWSPVSGEAGEGCVEGDTEEEEAASVLIGVSGALAVGDVVAVAVVIGGETEERGYEGGSRTSPSHIKHP